MPPCIQCMQVYSTTPSTKSVYSSPLQSPYQTLHPDSPVHHASDITHPPVTHPHTPSRPLRSTALALPCNKLPPSSCNGAKTAPKRPQCFTSTKPRPSSTEPCRSAKSSNGRVWWSCATCTPALRMRCMMRFAHLGVVGRPMLWDGVVPWIYYGPTSYGAFREVCGSVD